MSDGNGSKEAKLETMCPINPGVRPGECQAIHAQLEELRVGQRAHGRAIQGLRRDLKESLGDVTEQLGKLVAAHGGKRAKGR